MLFQPIFSGGEMDWYCITLPDGTESSEFQQKIRDVFVKFFTTSGSKEAMGVFIMRDILQQKTRFYFTPTAGAIAKFFRATRCGQPPKLGMKLFAGPDTCWNLFAEED